MARLPVSLPASLALALVGSVLLTGAAPPVQEPESSIAINQVDTGLSPSNEGNDYLADNGIRTLLSPADEAKQRQQFLFIQGLFAAAVSLSSLALVYGVSSYRKQHKRERLEFLRQATRQFEHDPGIANALSILDFEEYRDYPISTAHGTTETDYTFQATNELLVRALASHDERKCKKKELNKLSPQADDHSSTLRAYQAESTLREWFNQMLNGLEHFGYLVDSQVFSIKEVKPWLLYWVRLIADENYRRNCKSQVYDQLYNYIYDYGFDGVKRLFEKFGYRILRSPYQRDDFQKLENVDQYSTSLALSLAKASRLIYQDREYVEEISTLWGVDTHQNFQYFNNNKRDTQAVIFRTDSCIVLAFRGSQEIRDWYTNFNTQLRNFTIRRAGKTTMSSYKGKVHTGFFLGWASIERAVLTQIEGWQRESVQTGQPLPPLLIAGHSLGGALATMAAASLHENGINVAGLYTFGQPRVGDRTFTRQLNRNLTGKAFRFVNNNDVVPHVPPPFSIRNPLRIYSHMGTVKYFNSKGLLMANYKAISRALDSLLGLIKSVFESGFDLIADHSMAYYISYLDNALEEEVKDRAAQQLERDVTRVGGAEAVNRSRKQ